MNQKLISIPSIIMFDDGSVAWMDLSDRSVVLRQKLNITLLCCSHVRTITIIACFLCFGLINRLIPTSTAKESIARTVQ